MIAPAERGARLAPWLAGAMLAAPIVAARYPPMGDLAMHEALVAILRHGRDASWAPPGMYSVVVPQANQLFHFLALAASFAMPTDRACTIVVAAIVLLAPVAMARWLARMDRSRWAALLVVPVACGWTFRWGLVANLLGFVLLLASLPLLDDLARRATPKRSAMACVVAALLMFAHESSAAVFAAVAAYAVVVRGGRVRATALRLAPAVVTVALAALQWHAARGLSGASMRSIPDDLGLDPAQRLATLPGAIVGGYDAVRTAVALAVWLAALGMHALPLLLLSCRTESRAADSLSLRVALWRHRHAVLAAGFFVAFLVFPMSIGGTTLLAHRFLPPACAFLVAACAARARAPGAIPRIAITAAVPLAVIAIEATSFAQSDARYRALDAIIARIPPNTAVAQLDLTPLPPGHVAPVVGAASRVQAERGGRMLFALTDMPPNPVYVSPSMRWDEPMMRLARAPFAWMPRWDAVRFEYLLVRCAAPRVRAVLSRAFEPEQRLVASEGEWDLYRSTLAVEAPTSPDRPLPDPPPETIAQRLDSILDPRRSGGRPR